MITKIKLSDLIIKFGRTWVDYEVEHGVIPEGWEGTPLNIAKMIDVSVMKRLEILIEFEIIEKIDLENWIIEQAEAFDAQECYEEAAASEYVPVYPEKCKWKETEVGWNDLVYETSCGHSFVMIEGTPKENGYLFCCSCGKPIKEIPLEVESEQ